MTREEIYDEVIDGAADWLGHEVIGFQIMLDGRPIGEYHEGLEEALIHKFTFGREYEINAVYKTRSWGTNFFPFSEAYVYEIICKILKV